MKTFQFQYNSILKEPSITTSVCLSIYMSVWPSNWGWLTKRIDWNSTAFPTKWNNNKLTRKWIRALARFEAQSMKILIMLYGNPPILIPRISIPTNASTRPVMNQSRAGWNDTSLDISIDTCQICFCVLLLLLLLLLLLSGWRLHVGIHVNYDVIRDQ